MSINEHIYTSRSLLCVLRTDVIIIYYHITPGNIHTIIKHEKTNGAKPSYATNITLMVYTTRLHICMASRHPSAAYTNIRYLPLQRILMHME